MTQIDFKQPFSLVLSGGGALGLAHLGVLHDLEQLALRPDEIIGTSMGGIVGACLAVEMSEKEISQEVARFSSLFNWLKFSFSGNSVVNNQKIAAIFEEIFQDKKMADTKIPLKIIATDLLNGNKKVFTAEDDVTIKDALLCTMAIPGIFQEHTVDGVIYGDGFLCENLGVNEATLENILAVDVLGENSFAKEMPDNFFKTKNVLEMFEKSMRLLIHNQTRTHLQNCNKNVILIEPCTKEYKTYHFHRTKEIRACGLNLLSYSL